MLRKHTVRDWMMELVVIVEPDTIVSEALSTMRRRYINSVIVNKTEVHPLYGIVTSRDICDKIVAEEKDPKKVKVSEIMSSPLITVNQSVFIQDCAKLMKENKIHHLPVVDDEEKIVGMISASDFLVVAEGMGSNFEDRALT
ncbi:MAG: CBS domain-containing protein [Anaerolineaceae bacterium]